MKLLALLALLLAIPLAGAAPPPRPRADAPPPLRVEGETVLVVAKLPFDVVCDVPADLYLWKAPAGWKVVEAGGRLTVTEAPEGRATVALQTIRIDWEARKTISLAHTLVVSIGKAPAPPGPADALAQAYAAEADGQKAAHVAKLAALYRAWEKAVLDTPPPTWGRLFEAMATAAKSMGLDGKVPAVRAVLAAEFRQVFPTAAATVLTQDGRALAAATFARVATRLETLR